MPKEAMPWCGEVEHIPYQKQYEIPSISE